MSEQLETVDVAIVGGGPAGLAAATELRRLGVAQVLVLEREPAAGGIPRHCGHYPFGMREVHRLLRGPDYAQRLVRLAEAAGVRIATGTTVTRLLPGGGLETTSDQGLGRVRARAVLLATGVRETSRAARLIGGEKPAGVLPTGALQGLVYLDGRRPFTRPVILGSELVAFSALLTCRHAGIRPLAIVEPGSRAVARWPVPLLARLLGVPFATRTTIEAINGRERVEAITLNGPEGIYGLPADGVIVTGGFRPETTLLTDAALTLDPATGGPEVDAWGRLSDPAYFAAGNILRGVETAGWSWSEGRRIARTIAAALASALPAPDRTARLKLDHPALRYALPQVLGNAQSGSAGQAERLQLRVNQPVRGRLCLWQGDRILVSRRIDSAPERRILLPLPAVRSDGGTVRVTIE